jgi:hypothetical protein
MKVGNASCVDWNDLFDDLFTVGGPHSGTEYAA